MRTGWSLKEAAAVLGIHERRVSQALDPCMTKIARLYVADGAKTLALLNEFVQIEYERVCREAVLRWEVEEVERLELRAGGRGGEHGPHQLRESPRPTRGVDVHRGGQRSP